MMNSGWITFVFDRPVVIGCLEEYMNGNNTDKAVGIENVSLVSRGSHKVLISMKQKREHSKGMNSWIPLDTSL